MKFLGVHVTGFILAASGLAVQPVLAGPPTGDFVLKGGICGQGGEAMRLIRIPRDEKAPPRDEERQLVGCAHVIRPKGPAVSQ